MLGGQYKPLSRPLYLYVTTKALARSEVKAFVEFYLEYANRLAAEMGYVAVPDDAMAKNHEALSAALVARGVKNVSTALPKEKAGATPPPAADAKQDGESDSDSTEWAPPLADGASDGATAEFEIAFSAARR